MNTLSNNSPSLSNDLIFGLGKEEAVLNVLNKCVSKKIKKAEKRSAIMDYYKEKNGKLFKQYEVKSRRVSSKAYEDYGFGKNKFDYACNQLTKGIKQAFLFNLTDGLWKWELTDPEKQKHEYRIGTICNYVRGDREWKPAVFVPLKYCVKFDE